MARALIRSIFLAFYLLLAILAPQPARAWLNITASPLYPNKTATVLLIKDDFYGLRNVSYWATDEGLAVIDGDVIYGTVDDLLAHAFHGQEGHTQRSNSIFHGGNPWAGATVRYNFNSAATQTLLTPIVNGAIANWKATAPYLTFKKVANSATGVNGVVTIKAPVCGGCNTPIGYYNQPLTMNLQQSCPAAPGSCGVPEATHEFGHALGLFHEHQRRDRETYVHYNCANLSPSCPTGTTMPRGATCCSTNIPAGCCAAAPNFNVIANSDNSGTYDIHSIMEYRANAFALPGTNTLTAVAKGLVVPVNNPSAITSTDSTRVCKIYPAQCPKARACAAAGCPTACKPVTRCTKPEICDSGKFKAPCCTPHTCTSEIEACTKKGCNFLIP